jgi:hypothetical protein
VLVQDKADFICLARTNERDGLRRAWSVQDVAPLPPFGCLSFDLVRSLPLSCYFALMLLHLRCACVLTRRRAAVAAPSALLSCRGSVALRCDAR